MVQTQIAYEDGNEKGRAGNERAYELRSYTRSDSLATSDIEEKRMQNMVAWA